MTACDSCSMDTRVQAQTTLHFSRFDRDTSHQALYLSTANFTLNGTRRSLHAIDNPVLQSRLTKLRRSRVDQDVPAQSSVDSPVHDEERRAVVVDLPAGSPQHGAPGRSPSPSEFSIAGRELDASRSEDCPFFASSPPVSSSPPHHMTDADCGCSQRHPALVVTPFSSPSPLSPHAIDWERWTQWRGERERWMRRFVDRKTPACFTLQQPGLGF